ncbi:hypothetical protein KCU67_g324, partial [Aureobasidium melanogenum]
MTIHAQADLDQMYFDRIHVFMPMLHHKRYIVRSRSHTFTNQPFDCLRKAVCMMAASVCQAQNIQDMLYIQAKTSLEALELNSGIGEYTLRSLAAHYGKSSQSLSLYLVGRNNDAASHILNDCRKLCSSGRSTFVKASDLSLIRDVDSASEEIKKLVGDASTKKGTAACIDLLVMSHADLHIGGRRETKEGLDKTMSMLYYSCIRFAINLIYMLHASKATHVISVFR